MPDSLKKPHFAHIINPVVAGELSDLKTAQPVTFQTMLTAKSFAQEKADVSLYTAQFSEDRRIVPEKFTLTQDLQRSVLDVSNFTTSRKLPLLTDILENLYSAAPDCDYMIYTNVDIAVMPHFYDTIADIIAGGVDAMVVNRRTISDQYRDPDEISMMYAQLGSSHPGHDCFVFNAKHYPRFNIGEACIGANWIGKILIANLIYHANCFKAFADLHLTFHIGDKMSWKNPAFREYDQHNSRILKEVIESYKCKQEFLFHPIILKQAKRLGIVPDHRPIENPVSDRRLWPKIGSLLFGKISFRRRR